MDWLATAKNWMLRDFADGKLVKSKETLMEEEKQEYSILDEMIDRMYG